MKPVSPVIPNGNFIEINVAENQDEYQTLPSIPLPEGNILCRWHMTDEERKIVAETGDIYLIQKTGGEFVTPMILQVEIPEVPVPKPLPPIMRVPRRTETIVNRAKEFKFEIFEGNCFECTSVVIFTAATKETLALEPERELICTVCLKWHQFFNPTLETVLLENTAGELRQIKEALENKELVN